MTEIDKLMSNFRKRRSDIPAVRFAGMHITMT